MLNRNRYMIILLGSIFFILAAPALKASNMIEVTDAFFDEVKKTNYIKAYTYTSEEFQDSSTISDIKDFCEYFELNTLESTTWNYRKIESRHGEIEGWATLKNGKDVPLMLLFVFEYGGWKILSIEKITSQSTLGLPGQEEAVKLAEQSILSLANAIINKDFNEFYENIATVWKEQTNPEELQAAFREFIDKEIDLTVIKGIVPEFDGTPGIDEQHILYLTGVYTVDSGKISFNLQFLQERNKWKLSHIYINAE